MRIKIISIGFVTFILGVMILLYDLLFNLSFSLYERSVVFFAIAIGIVMIIYVLTKESPIAIPHKSQNGFFHKKDDGAYRQEFTNAHDTEEFLRSLVEDQHPEEEKY